MLWVQPASATPIPSGRSALELISLFMSEESARMLLDQLLSTESRNAALLWTRDRNFLVAREGEVLRVFEDSEPIDVSKHLQGPTQVIAAIGEGSMADHFPNVEFFSTNPESLKLEALKDAFIAGTREIVPKSRVYSVGEEADTAHTFLKGSPKGKFRIIDITPFDDASDLHGKLKDAVVHRPGASLQSIKKDVAGQDFTVVVGHMVNGKFSVGKGHTLDPQAVVQTIVHEGAVPFFLACGSAGACGLGPTTPIFHRKVLEGLIEARTRADVQSQLDMITSLANQLGTDIVVRMPSRSSTTCENLLTGKKVKVVMVVLIGLGAGVAVDYFLMSKQAKGGHEH
jgi:hypothetical protein